MISTTRNKNKQRTIENKMEFKAKIQIWKLKQRFKYRNYRSGNQSKGSNLEIKAKIQIWNLKQKFKYGNY
jgi:hypothetical protein